MRIEHLLQRVRDLGAKSCHEQRVLRAWTQVRSLDTRHRRAEDFLPLALRHALPQLFDELHGLARLQSEHPGEDGSARLLVGLADGQTVEVAANITAAVIATFGVGLILFASWSGSSSAKGLGGL